MSKKLITDIDYQYLKVLAEIGKTEADLPPELLAKLKDLKKKARILKPQAGTYEKDPSDKNLEIFNRSVLNIEKLDYELSQELYDWDEKDLPDGPAEPVEPIVAAEPTEPVATIIEPSPAEPIEPVIQEPVAATVPPEPVITPAPAEPDPPKPADEPVPNNEVELEAALRTKINRENRIEIDDITAIMGRNPNGLPVNVGKLHLRKVIWNSHEYRVI